MGKLIANDKLRAALAKRNEAFAAEQKLIQLRAERQQLILDEQRHRQERQETKQLAMRVRAELCRRFPLCFKPAGEPKTPLKIDIHKDLAERAPDIGPWSRHAALSDYVKGESYHTAMVTGAQRLDLDGNPAGEVKASHERRAQKELGEIRAFKERVARRRALRQKRSPAA